MEKLYSEYQKLDIKGNFIDFEKGDVEGGYFCTPIGAKVLGWCNSVHYCVIKGFGDTVFCVEPDLLGERYVFPVAKNFNDFLGLLLTVKTATVLEQIILWNKEQFNAFINAPDAFPFEAETDAVLNVIKSELGISPIENAFEYVKALQADFDYGKIEFSDEFYDVTGIERT